MIILPIAGTKREYGLSPSKIIAVGLNYREHVAESKAFDHKPLVIPTEPVLFAKTPNCLIGPGEPILIPSWAKSYGFDDFRVDHEAELAILIGRRGKHIAEKDALDYVFGYTCFNDVSQRNIQKSDVSGWFRGKSFDTFGPVGPVVVLRDALPGAGDAAVRCRVNGTQTQFSRTSAMIFSIARLISFISENMTLEEGDLIATGTPSGVSPIKAGDQVEVEIEGIGILRNPVADETLP
jgi:2-keto-4-pentenoate hydratase/2-oxohepta-3-ene-1,7-dioic acid hydratase in catechol pathway